MPENFIVPEDWQKYYEMYDCHIKNYSPKATVCTHWFKPAEWSRMKVYSINYWINTTGEHASQIKKVL